MSLRLIQAREALRAAGREIQRALAEDYPVGAPVRWVRNGHVYTGIVRSHGFCGRVLVQRDGMPRPYWIDDGDIADASGMAA
ncbi:hypothetical protein [Bradyrhizobium sp. STM 3557]|uniref:hypothetical protein n=1 Tax=Bradyrhizobium sp. STM 3557 TaxID=578920 RepID=UPI00388ED67B